MPTQLQTALETTPIRGDVEADTLIRYPPFPAPPPGVTIIPFSDFIPKGIIVSTIPDQIELDGENVPTIFLKVKHTLTDAGEKKKKKKRKTGGAGGGTSTGAVPERKVTWWEKWKEDEETRGIHVTFDQANIDPYDRLKQATHEFVSGRTWPIQAHLVHKIWGSFKYFAGLTESVQLPKSPDEQDEASDEEPPLDGEYPMADQPHESGIQELEEDRELTAEEMRMGTFMEDPERSIKIFLSSYFRNRGLIWNEVHCHVAPRLLVFYLTFLLRTRAIPFSTASENLERAIAVAQLGMKELPATFSMGEVIPGNVSQAFVSTWGTRCTTWDDALPDLPPLDEPVVSTAEEFAQGLKDANMEEVNADELTTEAAQREVLGDNKGDPTSGDTEGNVDDVGGINGTSETDGAGSWGAAESVAEDSGAGTWGAATNAEPDADTANTGAWGTEAAWGAPADGDASTVWGPAASDEAHWSIHKVTGMELMGPTSLPLTHSTGVVEESTRRIIAVYPPTESQTSVAFSDAADAVEHELQRRFGRVLLAPWGTSAADSDIIKPSISKKSRGPVIERNAEGKKQVVGNDDGLQVKPHDPLKDNITVLVDPAAVGHLVVNMGIGATWIQIVRDGEDGVVDRKGFPSGFWYMEGMSQVIVSFHADDEP